MSFKNVCAALCGVAVLAAGQAYAVMINEFQPNPTGADPANVDIELLGTPSASFSGWLLTVDTDFSPGNTVDRATAVSGTFDANGLAVVSVPDLENPSFTIALVDNFTGATGDVLDSADDLAGLGIGTVFDAINTPDNVGDEANSIAASVLGGTDLVYTGDEPKLIFRDGADPSVIYSINDPAGTDAIDQDGNLVPFANFDMDPEGDTFGRVNPTAVPEPASFVLFALGAVGLVASRKRG